MAHDTVPGLPVNTSWYQISLDAEQLDAEVHEPLKRLFEQCYLQAGKPKRMALWFAARTDGGADIYMSPQSVILRGAPDCTAPT